MRVRLLMTTTAIALTLCACGRSVAVHPTAGEASAPLTLERHFGRSTIGTHTAATGVRRPGFPHVHGPSVDDTGDAVAGDAADGSNDGSVADDWTDDDWTDDDWTDDDWIHDDWTDDDWTDDDEWAGHGSGSLEDDWSDADPADDAADDGSEPTVDGSDAVADGSDPAGDQDDATPDESDPAVDEGADAGPLTSPAADADLDTAVADLRVAWGAAVPGTGTKVVVVPSGQRIATACSDGSLPYATSDDAFYCDSDDTIVIGADVLSETRSQFGAGGVAFLIAHEYGHNLQLETGAGAADSATAMPTELHADCLAGAYLADALHRGTLDAAALDQARAAASSVGDDDVDDPDHHGTSAERVTALNAGIAGGDCKAFLG